MKEGSRTVTTELLLIAGWCVPAMAEINGRYGAALTGAAARKL